ncbi:hypothetical protein BJV78DRAFT_1198499 [Lactifluus subvellereus]|nr:hypothetical protein BJV78DRAFT_1198499 [Lactifluus subvellereus]
MLPVCLDAFKVLLDLDQQDVFGKHWDEQTLDTIHTSFPRIIAPYLLIAQWFQIHPRANRSSCTSLFRHSSTF